MNFCLSLWRMCIAGSDVVSWFDEKFSARIQKRALDHSVRTEIVTRGHVESCCFLEKRLVFTKKVLFPVLRHGHSRKNQRQERFMWLDKFPLARRTVNSRCCVRFAENISQIHSDKWEPPSKSSNPKLGKGWNLLSLSHTGIMATDLHRVVHGSAAVLPSYLHLVFSRSLQNEISREIKPTGETDAKLGESLVLRQFCC